MQRQPRTPVWRQSLGSYDEWRRITRDKWQEMGGDRNPDLLRTRSPYGQLYWIANKDRVVRYYPIEEN